MQVLARKRVRMQTTQEEDTKRNHGSQEREVERKWESVVDEYGRKHLERVIAGVIAEEKQNCWKRKLRKGRKNMRK